MLCQPYWRPSCIPVTGIAAIAIMREAVMSQAIGMFKEIPGLR
jgi:hypothetical protein